MTGTLHRILSVLANDTIERHIADRWPVPIETTRRILNAEISYDLGADMYQNSKGFVRCNVDSDYGVSSNYRDGSIGRSGTSIEGTGKLKPSPGGCSLEIDYVVRHFSLTRGVLVLWMLVGISLGVGNSWPHISAGNIGTGALVLALHLGFSALGLLIFQHMKSEISSLHLTLSNTVFSHLASQEDGSIA